MKKLLLILFLFTGTFVKAQQGPDAEKREDRIQALKIAFISQKLELTTEEAQRFWPVYNSYQAELKQTLRDRGNNVLDNDEKLLNLRKKFKPEFARIVGQPRVNTFFGAEREFRSVLLKHLKNKGGNGGQQRDGMRRPPNP